MTVLLIVAMVEIPVVALASLWFASRLLSTHGEILAAVIGRKARDVREALGEAEGRLSEAARTGVVSRAGPARLKD